MRTDLLRRAALPAAALVALAAGVPEPLTGLLVLAGLALAAERLARLRGAGTTDAVLVGVGGVLVALVLTGMLLGSTPLGLGHPSWVVALAVLSGCGLAVAAVLPPRSPDTSPHRPEGATGPVDRRQALVLLPWLALSAAVVAASVQLTSSSLAAATTEPVQMSFGQVSSTEVEVVITTSDPVGPVELRTAVGGQRMTSPTFSLGRDEQVTRTVRLPATGRAVISLRYPGQDKPLRTLILDR